MKKLEHNDSLSYVGLETCRSEEERVSQTPDRLDKDEASKSKIQVEPVLDARIVSLPKQSLHQTLESEEFCSNVVITSKYTTWNFLPKFLIQSFRKVGDLLRVCLLRL